MAIFSRKLTIVLAVDCIVDVAPPAPFRWAEVEETAEGVLLVFFLPKKFILIVIVFIYCNVYSVVLFAVVYILIVCLSQVVVCL